MKTSCLNKRINAPVFFLFFLFLNFFSLHLHASHWKAEESCYFFDGCCGTKTNRFAGERDQSLKRCTSNMNGKNTWFFIDKSFANRAFCRKMTNTIQFVTLQTIVWYKFWMCQLYWIHGINRFFLLLLFDQTITIHGHESKQSEWSEVTLTLPRFFIQQKKNLICVIQMKGKKKIKKKENRSFVQNAEIVYDM